jgi:hypothetical protein
MNFRRRNCYLKTQGHLPLRVNINSWLGTRKNSGSQKVMFTHRSFQEGWPMTFPQLTALTLSGQNQREAIALLNHWCSIASKLRQMALAFLIYFIFLSECFYIRRSSWKMAVYYSVSGSQDHEWMCVIECYMLGVREFMTPWMQYGSDYIIKCLSMG